MKKAKSISIIVAGVLAIMGVAIGLTFWIRGCSEIPEKLELQAKSTWKVEQYMETIGKYNRTVPTETKDEGLLGKYPSYGTGWEITDDVKVKLFEEDALLRASSSTYDSMDVDGNLYLSGVAVGRKLYKHTSSVGMYYGDISDDEPAVIERITFRPAEERNYITGLYAPAGEVIKIEISQEDLDSIGGLTVAIGQVSHRNINNTIIKDRTNFTRMPNIGNVMRVTTTEAYVGNFLGGPIYIRADKINIEFSVVISGGVKYPIYIHNLTTEQDLQERVKTSAPYYDFEVWERGVRHSGTKRYGNFDYANLKKCGELWQDICLTSRLVPETSNSSIGVSFVYDTHIWLPGAAACAWQGPHTWVNAPNSALGSAISYENFTYNGVWGIMHEFNHHYQNYGIASYGEVTNNATTLLSYVCYTNISSRRTENISSLGNWWNRLTVPSVSLSETLANGKTGQTSVNIYADILHSFGVEIYAEATRLCAGKHTADDWYESVSTATGYNMTYYFEELLGHTISDDVKAKFESSRPVFVPVATLYQTGRSYESKGTQKIAKTVRPYTNTKGQTLTLDFEKNLVMPDGFDFEIVEITNPKNGTLTQVSDKKYEYNGGNNEDSGEFEMTIKLKHASIATPNVTFTFEINQIDPDATQTKYTYDTNLYSSVDEAVENNFEGYSEKNVKHINSTFQNGIGSKQIGVNEGKIYITSDGEYTFCLRAGRGKHALFVSTDGKNYNKVISFEGNRGGFEFGNDHDYKVTLKKGDYLWYKQVTISNNHPDAFTELGWTNTESKPVSVPSSNIYNVSSGFREYDFEYKSFLNKSYTKSETLSESDSTKASIVSINMPGWDETTKPENIFDNNPDTFYHSNQNNFVSQDNPWEIVVDFGQEKVYNNLTILNRNIRPAHMPTTFALYGGTNIKNLTLLGQYTDVSYSGLTMEVGFESTQIRYLKMVVTNTSAIGGAANKYVSIADMKLNYKITGSERSCDEMQYYGFEIKSGSIATFGHLISGKGYLEYEFEGTDFALYTRKMEKCQLTVEIDGKVETVTIDNNEGKSLGVILQKLKAGKHKLKITVVFGTLNVDSILVA